MNDDLDVCVYGHVSEDLITSDDNRPLTQPGGAALYNAATLASLGIRVRVVTKVAIEDQENLLAMLRRLKVDISALPSPTTTKFENIYSEHYTHREQRVISVAAPFLDRDLDDCRAAWIVLLPLSAAEMDIDFINRAAAKATVALDIQGMLRLVEGGGVVLRTRPGLLPGLSGVRMLKANHAEAHSLTGIHDPGKAARAIQSLGPREVIITLGGQGSLIQLDDQAYHIPAFAASEIVDRTGCGDTYFAAYIYRRMRGDTPANAGQFAAVCAALKLARHGPFLGNEHDVTTARDRLHR